jgi:ABC-2 type transport system permease protein
MVESFLITLSFNIAILLLLMVTTGRWLHLDVVSLLLLVLLTLAGVYGIGLIAAPVDRFPILRALPLVEGNRLIRQVMAGGLSIIQLPAGDLPALVINSAFYLGIGLIAFNLLLKTAKNRGLLGHY